MSVIYNCNIAILPEVIIKSLFGVLYILKFDIQDPFLSIFGLHLLLHQAQH